MISNLESPRVSPVNTESEVKTIYHDYVHGYINLHPLIVQIIASECFQRLKHIKQMSCIGFIHSTLQQSRFDHSIGTYHVARLMLDHLKESQPELDITPQDSLCVQVAALCHDLGHGPFSHLFEKFIKAKINKNFKHETMSKIIFNRIFKNLESSFNQYGLFTQEKTFIIELISPKVILELQNIKSSPPSSQDSLYQALNDKLLRLFGRGLEKAFIFEIVSNYVNGIDVDKWDYLTQDSQKVAACMSLGCPTFDFKSLLGSSKVLRIPCGTLQVTHIAFNRDQVGNIYRMYNLRKRLIILTILDPDSLSIREMLLDILSNMSELLNFPAIFGDKFDQYLSDQMSESTETDLVDSYLKLDDRILELIPRKENDDMRVQLSKTLKERIEKRQLYTWIGSKVFKTQLSLDESGLKAFKRSLDEKKENFLEMLVSKSNEQINCAHHETIPDLDLKNIIFSSMPVDFGMGNSDPLTQVLFYDKLTRMECKPELCLKSELNLEHIEETHWNIFLRKKHPQETESFHGANRDFEESTTDIIKRTFCLLVGSAE